MNLANKVREKRKALETALLPLFMSFEKETGFTITEIRIVRRIKTVPGSPDYELINNVSLEITANLS